jgi:hypothetical protein
VKEQETGRFLWRMIIHPRRAFSRDNAQLGLSSKILALAGSLSYFRLFSC